MLITSLPTPQVASRRQTTDLPGPYCPARRERQSSLARHPEVPERPHPGFPSGFLRWASVAGLSASAVAVALETVPVPYFAALAEAFSVATLKGENVEIGGAEWWRTPVTSGFFKLA
jgi:hypothetical protein